MADVGEGVGGATVEVGVAGVSVGDGVAEGVGAAVGDGDGEAVGDGRIAVEPLGTDVLWLAAGAAHAATRARMRMATTG